MLIVPATLLKLAPAAGSTEHTVAFLLQHLALFKATTHKSVGKAHTSSHAAHEALAPGREAHATHAEPLPLLFTPSCNLHCTHAFTSHLLLLLVLVPWHDMQENSRQQREP